MVALHYKLQLHSIQIFSSQEMKHLHKPSNATLDVQPILWFLLDSWSWYRDIASQDIFQDKLKFGFK